MMDWNEQDNEAHKKKDSAEFGKVFAQALGAALTRKQGSPPPEGRRFEKGDPPGPGRPRGSKNLKTLALEALDEHAERNADELARSLFREARNGNVRAIVLAFNVLGIDLKAQQSSNNEKK